MKKLIYLSLLSLFLFMAACGNSDKLPNDGLFGKLPNKYANYDGKENFAEIAAQLFEGQTIPVDVDADVQLTIEPMHFDVNMLEGNHGTNVQFKGEAKTKRAGVYDASTAWNEPINDDEAYDFYWRIGMLMYDKEGNPVYVPDFLLTGLEKSGLKRVVNPENSVCSYICSFGFSPVNMERLAKVAKILLIDRKGAREEEYNKLKEVQEKEAKEYRESLGKEY